MSCRRLPSPLAFVVASGVAAFGVLAALSPCPGGRVHAAPAASIDTQLKVFVQPAIKIELVSPTEVVIHTGPADGGSPAPGALKLRVTANAPWAVQVLADPATGKPITRAGKALQNVVTWVAAERSGSLASAVPQEVASGAQGTGEGGSAVDITFLYASSYADLPNVETDPYSLTLTFTAVATL